jgi:signal transduction histidine kinase
MIETERLVAIGTMSTGIAHEINNPLAIINESAGFMKEVISSSSMSEVSKRDALLLGIEKIEKSVKRAGRITHQLLGHVKKQDSLFSEVNLEILLNETLLLLKKEIEDKEIFLKWNGNSDCNSLECKPLIWSDPYQIRQVFINLLSNAVHAVRKGGVITLSWSISSFGNSSKLNNVSNDYLLFEIKDNGVGIAPENLGKIFDPFFTTKSFEEGTGLGLFVVHKIVSNLGGEIEVQSTLGKGSSFIVKLPIHFEYI